MYSIDTTHRSPNYNSRDGAKVTTLILHATVGSANSALGWLCNPQSQASTHYLITKTGKIYQLVGDLFRAWHAGVSSWQGVKDCNDYSIGCELENDNSGNDPYPQTQIDALKWLTKQLIADHPTLQSVASHAEVALPEGRKTDPLGFPLILFRAWVASLQTPQPAPFYTELSPILGSPLATRAQLKFQVSKKSEYNQKEVEGFFDTYWTLATSTGVDPIIPIAQMLHETGDLLSFWSQRPQRNPAGIGVETGGTQRPPLDPKGWAYNTQRNQWERGVSFPSWADDSQPAHVGRLLQYALIIGGETPEQRMLMARSSAAKPFPLRARGSAPLLRELGYAYNPALAGWAKPGEKYGLMVAQRANRLIGGGG